MGRVDRPGRYWPALDGMRAVAVLLVVAYHGERSLAPRGGAIGVTMFFTLSGFLITTLLLEEQATHGGIRLGRFYRRRALRLLPALVALVGVTVAYAAVVGDDRTIAAAAPVLLYVGNWVRTVPGTEGLGLLEHTWSLSVEEQFYLLWPLVVLAVAARVPVGRRAEATLAVALAGSAASLLWRLQLWDEADPRWSAARLYNGTDAVADQLLLGAALAAALAIGNRAGREAPARADRRRRSGAVLGPVALGYLVVVAALQPGGTSIDNDRLYLQWGSMSFAAASAVVVLGAVHAPEAWLSRLLSAPPLVAIGRVSYGIYLWHYPVILVLEDRAGSLPGLARVGLVLGATAAATAASWVLVERPFLRRKERQDTVALALR